MNTKTLPKKTEPNIKTLPIDRIVPSPENVRKTFDEGAMAELTASVKAQGILQSLVVRPTGKGKPYEIVAGERRYRAAKRAGLKVLPVIIQKVEGKAALEMTIAENELRDDVPLFERAEGYHRLMTEFGATLDDIAKRIGKSKSTVRDLLKLRHLPEKSRAALAAGEITPALAQLIAGAGTEAMRLAAEEWALGDEYDEPPAVCDMKTWIQHNCRVELKRAPFDQRDKKLVPEVGSCKDCPKRAGNMPDSAVDMRADVCTDPDCYRGKVVAHGRKVLDQKSKEGYRTLPEEEYEEVFRGNHWVSGSCKYLDFDSGCYDVPGKEGMTNRALFEPLTKPHDLAVATNPRGEVVYLIAKSVQRQLIAEHFAADIQAAIDRGARVPGGLASGQADGKEWFAAGRGAVAAVRMRARIAGLMAEEEAAESEALRHAMKWILSTMWARPRDEFIKSIEVEGKTVGEKTELIHDRIDQLHQEELFDMLVEMVASIKAFSSDPEGRKELDHWFTDSEKGGDQ